MTTCRTIREAATCEHALGRLMRSAWRRSREVAYIRAPLIKRARRALAHDGTAHPGRPITRAAWQMLARTGLDSDPGLWLALVTLDCVVGERCWVANLTGERRVWHQTYRGDGAFVMKLLAHVIERREEIRPTVRLGVDATEGRAHHGDPCVGRPVLVLMPPLTKASDWLKLWTHLEGDRLESGGVTDEGDVCTRRSMPFWRAQVRAYATYMLEQLDGRVRR